MTASVLEKTELQNKEKNTKTAKILVVEDEENIAQLLVMAFKYEGWEVESVSGGAEALIKVNQFQPDALVLDMMLPDFNGIEVMQKIRSTQPFLPVMFLTAKDSVADRVAGLTAGGDDYMVKPFSLEEVLARMRALLRRGGLAEKRTHSILQVGDLKLDEDSYEVKRGKENIELTATEFELLRYLMRNEKRVVSKAQILDRVWEYDFGGQANIVELYISYLRKKIDANHPPMIKTVRSVGYILKAAE